MKWIVKRSYKRLDEQLNLYETPVEEVYRGESRFLAWLVYRWCTFTKCPTVMMYNAPAEEVGVERLEQWSADPTDKSGGL